MTTEELKALSKEEFMKLEGATEALYNSLQNAKSGFISIRHRDRQDEHHGYTETFGEGISVRLETPHEWYITSQIQKINEKEKWFKTLNSIYDFEFIENEK